MNEQQLRNVIRQILSESESDIVLEYYGGMTTSEYRGLLSHLTEPFKDVARAAALTGQDVLNSLRLMFDTLTTLSPAKLKKAREEYKKRNDAIGRKWEPIMRASESAVMSSDLGLVLFALDPSMFLGAQLGKVGLEALTSVPAYLEDAGWEIPLLKTMGIVPPKSERDRRDKESDASKRNRKPLQVRLKNIFYGTGGYDYTGDNSYGESVSRNSRLINEEDDAAKKSSLTPENFRGQLESYLDATGLDAELKKLYDNLYNSKKEQIDDIMKDVSNQLGILKKFGSAKSLKDFDDVIKNAKTMDVDVAPIEKKITDLKSGIEKKADDVRTQLEKDKEKKLSPEQIETAVKDAANKAASEALDELIKDSKDSLNKALSSMRAQVEETLTADWPKDKVAARSNLSKTPEGKKYLALIDGALNNISANKESQ